MDQSTTPLITTTSLSVRPKVRSSIRNNETCQYEPLEKRRVIFLDQNREKKFLPLISQEFNVRINCPLYYEPSFDEFNNFIPMSNTSWIVNCKKFESFLSSIVNLPYFRFWSVVVFNKDVHNAVESYLSYSIRPYRIHPILKNNDIKLVLSNIHTLVFRFYVRILLNKETGKNYMSEKYHSELLINNNILDISKILDLIQLYGYGSNSEILKYLLKSFISKNYSLLKNDLQFVLMEIIQFFVPYENDDCYDINNDLVYVIANVTDVLFSLNKLIHFVPQIAFVCQEINLLEQMIKFYSVYFPFIENETLSLLEKNAIVENLYNYFKSQLCLSKASALLLFRNIIHFVFIEPLIDLQDDNKYRMFDNLINFLNFLANEKRFCSDYFGKFPFEKEFEALLKNEELNKQLTIVDVLEYYNMSLKTIIQEWNSTKSRTPNNKTFSFFLESTKSNVAAKVQQQPQQAATQQEFKFKTDAETIGKEQLILEMFPDLGDGFVYKCLEHFDFNNERVVDAILESKLPFELSSLNKQLTKSDLAKLTTLQIENQVLTDSIKYDPSTNTNYELTDIYIGKKDKLSEINLDKNEIKNKTIKLAEKMEAEEEKMKEQIKNLIESGKIQREELSNREEFMGLDLYEDEFDDTYENEDNFDIEPINQSNDSDTNDNEDSVQTNIPLSSNQTGLNQNQSNVPKYKMANEKYENCAKYFRKQLYNRKRYNNKSTGRMQQSNNVQIQQQKQQQQQQNINQDHSTRTSTDNRLNNSSNKNFNNANNHRRQPNNYHHHQQQQQQQKQNRRR